MNQFYIINKKIDLKEYTIMTEAKNEKEKIKKARLC